MKNIIQQKRQHSYRYFCNNWCCPCNDGKTGCFAEEHIMNLCDANDVGFLKLLDNCYSVMLIPEEYEKECNRFFTYCDHSNEPCPAFYKGYCSEFEDGCFNPKECTKRIELFID